MMRGIVLAGGCGTRMGNLTQVINKHLLPVGRHPMIYWPISVLLRNGITDITIVSSPQGIGPLAQFLGGAYTYRVQDRPGGIAHAIGAANVPRDQQVAVILGDNIFSRPPDLNKFKASHDPRARCYLKEVTPDRIRQFGVPTFDDDGRITRIDEKPFEPLNHWAVVGLYVFTPDVFTRIASVNASMRGEMEVTDLLNTYAAEGVLEHDLVIDHWWDAGTPEALAACSSAIMRMEEQGVPT